MIYVIKLSGFFQICKFISTAKYMYLTLFAFQLDAGYQFSFAKHVSDNVVQALWSKHKYLYFDLIYFVMQCSTCCNLLEVSF